MKRKCGPLLKKVGRPWSKEYDFAVLQWYDSMESAVCESRNLNSFYFYTNKKIKNQAFIPPLKSASGSTAVTDVAKAEELNAVFRMFSQLIMALMYALIHYRYPA